VKLRRLALTALLLVPSACNQAPDDDPASVSARTEDQMRQRQFSRADAAASRQNSFPVKYELQVGLGAPRPFPSRDRCEGARRAIAEAQAKADKERSEHGVLLPRRPMMTCVAI
jgi:hypothetical protein